MKRHESIRPLSREHHHGLLFCWKIRQGIRRQVPSERIKHYVQYFWEHHLRQHFDDEETLLFPGLQGTLCDRAIFEHQCIRQLLETILRDEAVSTDKYHSLADSLEKHIRFEERALFPQIEQELSDEALTDIGTRLKLSDKGPQEDDYPDGFWV